MKLSLSNNASHERPHQRAMRGILNGMRKNPRHVLNPHHVPSAADQDVTIPLTLLQPISKARSDQLCDS